MTPSTTTTFSFASARIPLFELTAPINRSSQKPNALIQNNSNLMNESRNTEGSVSLLICEREMTMPPGSLLLGCARAMIIEDQTSEYKNGKTEEENQEAR